MSEPNTSPAMAATTTAPDVAPQNASVAPPPRPVVPTQHQVDPLKAYRAVSETVGFVPSIGLKDNLVSAIGAIGGLVIGAAIGAIASTRIDAPILAVMAVGAVLGLAVGTIGVGAILGIVGVIRRFR